MPFMKKVIKGLFVIGMTVQICMGFVWMCVNAFSVQKFSEATEYIEMSSSFVLDEYVGILYPLLLFLLRIMTGEILCYTFLYILQVTVAFCCNCAFLQMSGLGEKKFFARRNIFGALYLVTVPFVAQLHMSVLPVSLTGSLFMLLLGLCFRIYYHGENGRVKNFVVACVLWTVMSLLATDYIWLGAIPFAWILGIGLKRNWKGKIKSFFIVGLAGVLLVTGTVNAFTQQPGSRNNIQRTLGAAMVSRLAWPSFEANYYFWPEEVKAVMPPLKAREIDQYADNVKLVMGPLFEEAFGKEQANSYYWQIALRCFSDRTKEILPRIGEDFVSYLFTPFAIVYQLSGGGYSYSGWNFDRMWEQEKALTSFYVEYSMYSFVVGMAILLIYLLVEYVGKKKRPNVNGEMLLCILCVLSQAIWYTMSGTYMMDYKNVPLIILLWHSVIIWGVEKINGCEE